VPSPSISRLLFAAAMLCLSAWAGAVGAAAGGVPAKPPVAPVRDVTDTYFGVAVPDPFRNLEDVNDASTRQWLLGQGEYAAGQLARIDVRDALRDELTRLLAPCEARIDLDRPRPLVMMVAGVNGAGKTTSIGKLAHWLADQHRTVLLAAGDTFRAAAREQLAVWGQRNGVEVIAQKSGDPAAVVFDAVAAARARGIDVLIADTAGRLPTQLHLMDELKRVRRSIGKCQEGAPQEVVLVLDGTNGQNALTQVRAFDEAVGLTGLIITKLDGTAKGGVLAAIARERRDRPLPIYFIGVGEKLEDLQPFVADRFAAALVGAD